VTVAIIAEDEAPQRDQLAALIAQLWPDLQIAARCADGTQALAAIARHRPAVAFLDIRMPGADGIEVARAAGPACHIVFITAYDDFAVQAFEEGAADYLLKPVKADRLALAVGRIKARLAAGQPSDLSAVLARLEGRLSPTRPLQWITASARGAVRMLPVDEVQLFQAQDKYTRVVTASEEAHIRISLKDLLPRLDPDLFWQVRRGAIVRLSAIRQIRRDDEGRLRLHLQGLAETIAVSSAFAGRFKGM
jgi:DNA-binding LytR/AlgR family response regulator